MNRGPWNSHIPFFKPTVQSTFKSRRFSPAVLHFRGLGSDGRSIVVIWKDAEIQASIHLRTLYRQGPKKTHSQS